MTVNNISIVWDFDETLTPQDSTTEVVKFLTGKEDGAEFWKYIKSLRGDQVQTEEWRHILASDAPIWMYALSRLAYNKRYPLNEDFFKQHIIEKISLYPNVIRFFNIIKSMENDVRFDDMSLKIHHFIVSAGLKDLIQNIFPPDVIKHVFGCRYTMVVEKPDDTPESVPVFCMDETMKTRSLFEISKGSFLKQDHIVNKRMSSTELWSPFENMIYIGDGDTDIPALALTRDRGGVGVIVYNPEKSQEKRNERLKNIRHDKRADLVTSADFSEEGELFYYIKIVAFKYVKDMKHIRFFKYYPLKN